MFSWLLGGQADPPAYAAAKSLFTAESIKSLQKYFEENKTGSDDTRHVQTLCNLHGSHASILAQRVASVVKANGPDSAANFSAYLIAKAKCEKQDEEATRQFTFAILAGPNRSEATAKDLQEVLAACAAELGLPTGEWVAAVSAGTLRQLASSSTSMAGGGLAPPASSMDFHGYCKWTKQLPALYEVLRRLLETPDLHPTANPAPAPPPKDPRWAPMLPQMVLPPQYAAGLLLLQPHWAWLLSSRLPPDHRQEWRLLFSSYRDGASFNTFMGRIAGAAPTLLLVRDTDGHLFGGYAPLEWAKKGSFYGEFATSIFGLLPETLVYSATGINSNFQWCGVNFSQLPNGVGFGGQPGHFALFLDSNFEDGISRPAATFANSPLSKGQTFKVEDVECWLLKPPEDEDLPGGVAGGGSILDRNKEDQKILELAGVASNHSAGVRRMDNTPIEE